MELSSSVKSILENDIVQKMSIIDWGKTLAKFNEVIHKHILKLEGFPVYDVDLDQDCPIKSMNNNPGYDIVIILDSNKVIRIQSKLRQIKGKTSFSRSVHFETTRRHSKKNINSSKTGHICYNENEFDYVMISLVNVKYRNDFKKWKFSLIPIKALIDGKTGLCRSSISSKILKKYEYNPLTTKKD